MKVDTGYMFWTLMLVVMIASSCKQIRKVTDIIDKPSARELYAREFENNDTIRLSSWQNEYQLAQNDKVSVSLPYAETGKNFKNRNVVYSYVLQLEEGSLLQTSVNNEVLGIRNFLDVLKMNSDSSFTHFSTNTIGENGLEIAIQKSGIYKVLIQPEIAAQGTFSILLYTIPSFGFPVVGKDNKAIQSYWGAVRQGGARSHEGIDIFAPKGTPVIAATAGMISSTGNKGLGGKQVWLRSGIFGKSLYYAHLDSILTNTGAKVNRGDTLGLVGNTGNARTTQPHLHFGIYTSGRGAINPLPFVKQTKIPSLKFVDDITPSIIVSASLANLRNMPTGKGTKIGEATKNDTLVLLGYTDVWAHIKSKANIKAFVHRSLISTPE